MTDKNKEVRVRIAPSPSGDLHVGTARAALFNELFARQQGGKFILRIEDTDKERSSKEFEKKILEGLEWLGLKWDEGPFYQSKRTELYSEAIKKLLDSGAAYQAEGSEAIKLKVEEQNVEFEDLVRGKVKVNSDSWGGDFVIARSANDPVYHLAVVVDDAEMNISHVIRGEDHLSNTPRHILIQRALGVDTPQYAHLPLLLDDKRAKMSKRKGQTGLLSFKDEGFLPEAMINYLALLGWNPGSDQEFFTHDELVKVFELSKVQKGGAVFSRQKLDSMNKHYLAKLSDDDLYAWGKAYFELDEGRKEMFAPLISDKRRFIASLKLSQGRVTSYDAFNEYLGWARSDWEAEYEPELLVWRDSDAAQTEKHLRNLDAKLEEMADKEYIEEKMDASIIGWIDENGWGKGDVLWPLRVSLTGLERSPSPFEAAIWLGKEETVRRIKLALDKIANNND